MAPALAWAACGAPEPPRVAQPARHVLLIVVDTLRADRLGAFGNPRDTSPTIDKLAARGLRFTNAIAQSSWTAPSMVSLLSGRYLAERRLSIPDEVTTLAERFRAGGFATTAFVSNPLISAENGFDRGFDRFHTAANFHDDPRIEDWLRTRGVEPSFTYVHLTEPHDPYLPPGRMVRPRRIAASESTRAAWAEETERRELEDLALATERIEAELARYEGEVRWTDSQVLGFMKALSDAGQLEHTAIAITADHGEGLWTHVDAPPFVHRRLEKGEPRDVMSLFQKRHGGHLFQELIRVPLVIAAPSLPSGVSLEQSVENVDLAPTLLELAGLPPSTDLQGRSLVGLVHDAESWPKRESFSMTRFARGVVRADGWKLVEPTAFGITAGIGLQLYQLRDDPEERHNLAPEHPELVRELAARIAEWSTTGLRANDAERQAVENRNLEAMRALGYVGSDDEQLDPPIER